MNLDTLASNILRSSQLHKRFVVALAGPPGAGKSTLSAALITRLEQSTSVALVAQDGFHFDNQILQQRDLLQRKGAPQTFDVQALQLLLDYLSRQQAPVTAPVFDRELDMVRGCAEVINPTDHILMVEGNYLLVAEQPWAQLNEYFDHRILLSPSRDILRHRLKKRWVDLCMDTQSVERKLASDLLNVDYVLQHSNNSVQVLAEPLELP